MSQVFRVVPPAILLVGTLCSGVARAQALLHRQVTFNGDLFVQFTFDRLAPPGHVVVVNLQNPPPLGYSWYTGAWASSSVNTINDAALRITGYVPDLAVLQMNWTWFDTNGPPIPGDPLNIIIDKRPPEAKADAPKFEDTFARLSPRSNSPGLSGVVVGRVTNAGGDPTLARVEYWNGSQWQGVIPNRSDGLVVTPSGHFSGYIRSSCDPPIIRVRRPDSNNFGYVTSDRVQTRSVSPMQSPVTPSTKRNRFRMREHGHVMGVRG